MVSLLMAFTFSLICLSINLRSYSEMRSAMDKNSRLGSEIQNLLDETVSLQEEIHALRSNPKVVSREVEKLGRMNLKY
jgi:cell division protein FtsB